VQRVRDSLSTTLEEKAAVRFPDGAGAAEAWVQRVRDSCDALSARPSKHNMDDRRERDAAAMQVRRVSDQKDLIVDREHNMFAKWAFGLGTKDLNREMTLAKLEKSSGLGEELMLQVREFRAKANKSRFGIERRKKRKAEADAAPSTIAGKRKKKANMDAPELDVEGMHQAGTLQKVKVSDLKSFLRFKDVKPKRLKPDLLQQVEELLA